MSSVAAFTQEFAAQLAPTLLTDIRVQTAFSPESVAMTGDDLAVSIRGGSPKALRRDRVDRLLYAVKPTIRVNSPSFGTKVFAPYGEATDRQYRENQKKLALATGLIVAGAIGSFVVLVQAIRS